MSWEPSCACGDMWGFNNSKPIVKKSRRRNDPWQKNSEENLEKDSPHVLFVFAWYEGLHCICPEIVMQLVNMEKGFVRFPIIACLSKPAQRTLNSIVERSCLSPRWPLIASNFLLLFT